MVNDFHYKKFIELIALNYDFVESVMNNYFFQVLISGILLSILFIKIDKEILPRTSKLNLHIIRVIFLYAIAPFTLLIALAMVVSLFSYPLAMDLTYIGGASLWVVWIACGIFGTKRLKA